jgi:hypothetical protein
MLPLLCCYQKLSVIKLGLFWTQVFFFILETHVKCYYAEFRYAECRGALYKWARMFVTAQRTWSPLSDITINGNFKHFYDLSDMCHSSKKIDSWSYLLQLFMFAVLKVADLN